VEASNRIHATPVQSGLWILTILSITIFMSFDNAAERARPESLRGLAGSGLVSMSFSIDLGAFHSVLRMTDILPLGILRRWDCKPSGFRSKQRSSPFYSEVY